MPEPIATSAPPPNHNGLIGLIIILVCIYLAFKVGTLV